ncbi:hypothetical protein BJF93_10985 [Xaviernesmea oryzae]|uniref:Uncharacterized protein n=1 Tax=Xaviernesmea oryzae TaxID=464029 RepID=A0A1Q9AXC8_9HYPH|nr:hypothetical protein [Xaviernesmea oryzae]OLP60089.1 hypothetical protein BJF93_10985 [Xaviernesmea oryzae]SEK37011.1 hypothetical protein SAMN04487976_10214 [Xaviernesmea oryzae]
MVYDWFTMFLRSAPLPSLPTLQPSSALPAGSGPVLVASLDGLPVELTAATAGNRPLILASSAETFETAPDLLGRLRPAAILLRDALPAQVQRLDVALRVAEAVCGLDQDETAILAELSGVPSAFRHSRGYGELSARMLALVLDEAALMRRVRGAQWAQPDDGPGERPVGRHTPCDSPLTDSCTRGEMIIAESTQLTGQRALEAGLSPRTEGERRQADRSDDWLKGSNVIDLGGTVGDEPAYLMLARGQTVMLAAEAGLPALLHVTASASADNAQHVRERALRDGFRALIS